LDVEEIISQEEDVENRMISEILQISTLPDRPPTKYRRSALL